jgi:hypothetical protein
MILAKASGKGKAGEGDDSRKVVLWDFRGDTGVVVGDRNTDIKGLYNGGYSVTPMCLETVSESTGSRLFQSIRFGGTAPEAPGGILILGCNNAEYAVWKFAVTATPPKDRDHGSILSKRYFTGSFSSIYRGSNACPLQIGPRYNRVRIGGEGMLEHRLLYSAPFEQTE